MSLYVAAWTWLQRVCKHAGRATPVFSDTAAVLTCLFVNNMPRKLKEHFVKWINIYFIYNEISQLHLLMCRSEGSVFSPSSLPSQLQAVIQVRKGRRVIMCRGLCGGEGGVWWVGSFSLPWPYASVTVDVSVSLLREVILKVSQFYWRKCLPDRWTVLPPLGSILPLYSAPLPQLHFLKREWLTGVSVGTFPFSLKKQHKPSWLVMKPLSCPPEIMLFK